jgi:hypothetical protein
MLREACLSLAGTVAGLTVCVLLVLGVVPVPTFAGAETLFLAGSAGTIGLSVVLAGLRPVWSGSSASIDRTLLWTTRALGMVGCGVLGVPLHGVQSDLVMWGGVSGGAAMLVGVCQIASIAVSHRMRAATSLEEPLLSAAHGTTISRPTLSSTPSHRPSPWDLGLLPMRQRSHRPPLRSWE